MQDSKQIDELFRLMDDVCENGDAALPALEQYLQTQTDAPEIDTEASLKKFKADHKEFFVKPHRGRRLCYRVFVVAAAVFAAGTVFALATGHNPFDYAAMWGAETFGFYRDDFPTSKDGKIIYYPDGSWDDRTNMPDYDHETYTALPENNTSSIEEYAQTLEPAEKSEPLPEYADLPDTDLSNVGLEKSDSAWDDGHIKMTKDYLLGEDSIFAKYEDHTKHSEMFVMISKVTDSSSGTIEKDDRPVLEYVKENTTWYIMHNLQQINAVALTGNYQVLISAPVSVDEMKSIIDSIYE